MPKLTPQLSADLKLKRADWAKLEGKVVRKMYVEGDRLASTSDWPAHRERIAHEASTKLKALHDRQRRCSNYHLAEAWETALNDGKW